MNEAYITFIKRDSMLFILQVNTITIVCSFWYKIFPKKFTGLCSSLRKFKFEQLLIRFYLPSCLGQEKATGLFGLLVKMPPAPLSITQNRNLTLSLFIAERQAGKV